jgi:hypothetical protein
MLGEVHTVAGGCRLGCILGLDWLLRLSGFADFDNVRLCKESKYR